MNFSGIPRSDFRERRQVGALPHARVLPQTQAGFARWSESRLRPIPTGAWNQMNPDHFEPNSETADEYAEAAAHSVASSKIGEGARAVNRLWWSLWLLLLPLIWPSSDWVGLIIMSQAYFVAAKLIQRPAANTQPAASPVNELISMERGEDCVQG